MRRATLLIIISLLTFVEVMAQQATPAVTVYREFQPATVYLSSGKKLNLSLANIFLKNSSLLYKSGAQTKEANMKTLERVEFGDRTYYRLDTILAYRVDTVGREALYCAQQIDFKAYQQLLVNNSQFTSLSLGDMVGYTTAEIGVEDRLPIISLFYFSLGGKYVLAHERHLKRVLSKEQRRRMAAVMSERDFSWLNEQCLLKVLRAIQ